MKTRRDFTPECKREAVALLESSGRPPVQMAAELESFFHTLKVERVHQRKWATREKARRDLFAYIAGYSNRARIHSALGYRTPNKPNGTRAKPRVHANGGRSSSAWVEQCLAPALNPGDVVILDNLGSHKGKAARHAIRAVGARLLFLPPYSPHLNT